MIFLNNNTSMGKNVKFWIKGCLIHHLFIACLLIIVLLWNREKTYYIPEADVYVRIEKEIFKEYNIKMSFSKDMNFGKDYVTYNTVGDIVYLEMYYIPQLTMCISNAHSTNQEEFNIIEYNTEIEYQDVSTGYRTIREVYTDSTFLKQPCYKFSFYDYFDGFDIVCPNGRIISNEDMLLD